MKGFVALTLCWLLQSKVCVQGGTIFSFSVTSIRQTSIEDFFKTKLYWATTRLSETCDSYEVEIRYFCLQHKDYPAPNEEEFIRVCNFVIADALKKHYERNVTMEDGQEYNLKIIPSRVTDETSTDDGSVYPIFLSFECGRTSNFFLQPNVLFYCKEDGDRSFMDTAAHEIGRAIVYASKGLVDSVTNKGTTTEEQVGFGDNEANCKEPELDLMQFYDKYSHSCFPPRSFYAKRKLANEEAVALITSAEQGEVPNQCIDETEPPEEEDFCGNLCFTDGACGGMCGDCNWFTCKM